MKKKTIALTISLAIILSCTVLSVHAFATPVADAISISPLTSTDNVMGGGGNQVNPTFTDVETVVGGGARATQ